MLKSRGIYQNSSSGDFQRSSLKWKEKATKEIGPEFEIRLEREQRKRVASLTTWQIRVTWGGDRNFGGWPIIWIVMALTLETQMYHSLPVLSLISLLFLLVFLSPFVSQSVFSRERWLGQMLSILNILPHLHTSKTKGHLMTLLHLLTLVELVQPRYTRHQHG